MNYLKEQVPLISLQEVDTLIGMVSVGLRCEDGGSLLCAF